MSQGHNSRTHLNKLILPRIDLENISLSVDKIAHQLFAELVIYSSWSDTSYEITELEFYIHSPSHPDIFAHKSSMQKSSGLWYFHQAPSGADRTREIPLTNRLRGGSRKGLDLTVGNEAEKIDGGILIRGVRRLDNSLQGSLVDGPCLVVNELLQLNSNIETINMSAEYFEKAHKSKSPIERNSKLKLCVPNKAQSLSISHNSYYTGPRVNLSMSFPTPTYENLVMAARPLRYVKYPEFCPKYRLSMIASQILSEIDVTTKSSWAKPRQIVAAKDLLRLGQKLSLENHLENLKKMDDKKMVMALGFLHGKRSRAD